MDAGSIVSVLVINLHCTMENLYKLHELLQHNLPERNGEIIKGFNFLLAKFV